MTKEYLESLKKILDDNDYNDTDNIIEYYGELIEDRKEAGESEEDIIKTLGDVEKIAKDLLGDIKVNIGETKDYTGGNVSEIKAKLLSCDLSIQVDESLSEIKVDYPRDERIILEQIDDTLSIREIKSNTTHLNDNFGIVISIPANYELNKLDVGGSSCDLDIGGYSLLKVYDLALFTASGDIDISGLNGDKAYIGTVSGDINAKAIKFDKMEFNSVSGDQLLDDVKAPKIKTNTVSGDLQAKNIETSKLETNSISGDTEIKCSTIDDLYCESISGDIQVNINGSSSDYTVDLKAIFKKRHEGHGDKTIVLKSKTGDIEYKFID